MIRLDVARSAAGARTLEARYYLAEDIFRLETERIFQREWLCVGLCCELKQPGSYFVAEVCGEQIIVLRDPKSAIRAFYNLCRHRGTRLCEQPRGKLSRRIQCPYHGWTYDLEGRLVAAPNMPESFEKSDSSLVPAAVQIWEGFILLNLAADPSPPSQAFKKLESEIGRWRLPELEVVHEKVYTVKANWKALFQNYSECYHCPKLHPHLNRLTPFRDSWNQFEEGPVLGGPMKLADAHGSMTASGSRCAAPLADSEDQTGLVYYYSFFPSFLLSLFPDYAMVHRIERVSCGESRVVFQWLFHPKAIAEPDFDPSGAIEFWDLTNRQDWHICELLQQGVGSQAYAPALYSDLESMVAAWDREYLRVLEPSR